MYRAKAYELGKVYDKALADYFHAESVYLEEKKIYQYANLPYCDARIGRLYYKMGDMAKAYEYYMKEFMQNSRWPESLEPSADNPHFTEYHREQYIESIRRIVLSGDNFENLNPYSSYEEFLDFMEKEHKKQDFPAENEQYMKFLREVKDEIAL